MTPSWRDSSLFALLATSLLCATVTVASASDVHLPTLISDSGVSRPEGNKGLLPNHDSMLRGGGGGGGEDGAVQLLHDADAPHEETQETHPHQGDDDGGDAFQCNTEQHADYGGPIAFVWGMNFFVSDAGECCAACKAHRTTCEAEGSEGAKFWRPSVSGDGVCGNHKWEDKKVGCNAWVYCPDEQCFSFDIHVHKKGECWLKYVEDPSRPAPWNGGDDAFPKVMRDAPRSQWPWAVETKIWPGPMPDKVSWTAGTLTRTGEEAPTHEDPKDRPDWWHKFCDARGGCTQTATGAGVARSEQGAADDAPGDG